MRRSNTLSGGVNSSAPAALGQALSKTAISLFIVLNLSVVLWSNRPAWAVAAADRLIEHVSVQTAYRIRYGGWFLSRYAHLTGLDNQWQMFGRQSRFNWWFQIQGVTSSAATADLPLPLQSERSFLQRFFFDFREAKYYLNLYADPDLQERYARHLCRAYPQVAGAATNSVRIVLHYQNILPASIARARGRHTEPESYSRPLRETPCSPSH